MWNIHTTDVEDFLLSPEGMKNLAATCMLIEAIGEGFKRIDKETDKKLLPMYAHIPWENVKGMRDHIAHGYFDIDAEIIFHTIKFNLNPLLEATRYFRKVLSEDIY